MHVATNRESAVSRVACRDGLRLRLGASGLRRIAMHSQGCFVSHALRALARAACCVFALAVSVYAQSPEASVDTIDGRSLRGVVSFDGSSLTVAGASMSLGDALSIRFDEASLEPAKPAPFCVWLRSGSIVPCTRIDGIAAKDGVPPTLVVLGASGCEVKAPLSSVAALRSRANDPQTFVADRAAPDENLDFLYVVKNGEPQRFSVLVDTIDQGVARFDLRGSPYEFAVHGEDSVAAIVFGKNTGFAPDRSKGARAQVSLTGGESLGGALLSIADGTLRMQLDEGTEFSASLLRVRAIDIASDKVAWLSTLQPTVEQTAAFDRVWPWTVDRSPAGAGIRVHGVTYARGLVLVPKTKLTFDLGGKFDRFECVAGLDERSGPLAHALMRVVADGKVVWEATQDGARAAPHALRLSIPGCRQLSLEADFGENFDLGDLCAFADARVLVTSETGK